MTSTITLKSGKEIYANRNMISITKNSNGEWELGEGYDGDIFLTEYVEGQEDYQPSFTRDELIELANIIINRWCQFQNDVDTGKVPVKSNV